MDPRKTQWTNAEDEVLKAAVMKYGTNEWGRIGSLMSRKSAQQCKARWVEWLDPRVCKDEWSLEEDQRLLRLVKVFPSQWGTISDSIGRTTQSCVDRYNLLLRRTLEDGDVDKLETTADVDGDVNAATSRPALPDAVDMDEDELEMLAEARARLANTRGKKAQRKEREKMMEETKRLELFRKKQQMQAEGLSGGTFGGNLKRLKKGQVDYNAEVPFEKTAPIVRFEEMAKAELLAEQALPKTAAVNKSVEESEQSESSRMKQRKRDQMEQRFVNEQKAVPILSLPEPTVTTSTEQIVEQNQELQGFDLDEKHLPPTTNDDSTSVAGSVMSRATTTMTRDTFGLNRSSANRSRLAEMLSALPKPKNDFDIED